MPNIDKISFETRKQIMSLANTYGADNPRFFGSSARGEATKESDVDILVRMRKGYGLLKLAGFEVEVEKILNCKVDVVDERGLNHPILIDNILSEAVPVYEEK